MGVNRPVLQTILSSDGVPIGVFRSGHGPPLVLVHGTSADHTRWSAVQPRLAERFTVYALDRRGRGASGDRPDYSLEQECRDLTIVVESIGEPAVLVGHSYGGVCSIGAVSAGLEVRKLVLYEPPLVGASHRIAEPLIAQMSARLAAGDRDGVLEIFLSEVVRAPERELAMLRRGADWAGRRAAAHTIPRELEQLNAWHADVAALRRPGMPILLMRGSDTAPLFRAAVDWLSGALPDARVAVLPGQKHIAMSTAPELFLRELMDFVAG